MKVECDECGHINDVCRDEWTQSDASRLCEKCGEQLEERK
jgi:predicted nucleic acid-binding Zn ribbon protein